MKAILVGYLPVILTKPGRYKASDSDGHTAISNESAPDAALALARKMKWKGEPISGGIRHGLKTFEVFVFADGDKYEI